MSDVKYARARVIGGDASAIKPGSPVYSVTQEEIDKLEREHPGFIHHLHTKAERERREREAFRNRKAPPLWGTAANAVNVTYELYDWGMGRDGEVYFEGFAKSIFDPDETLKVEGYSGVGKADVLRYASVTPFAAAPLYLVTSEMAAVAGHAARSLQDQALQREDLPGPEGCILLNGNYPHTKDSNDKWVGTSAFSWAPLRISPTAPDSFEFERDEGGEPAAWRSGRDGAPGILVSCWSDVLDPEDDFSLQMREQRGPKMPRLQLYHVFPWPFGSDISAVTGHSGTAAMLRYFVSLLTLMRQRIAVSTPTSLPRPTRREFARKGRELPELKVITLRRAYNPRPEKGGAREHVDWSHRWMVGGHWRNQWYPSVQDHRQLWIAPYVKGPEGKPLVLPDEVYKLRR